jgi:hypothetical protein
MRNPLTLKDCLEITAWFGQNRTKRKCSLFKELQIPEGLSAKAACALRALSFPLLVAVKDPPRGAFARARRSGRRWRSPGGLLIRVLYTERSVGTHLFLFSDGTLRTAIWARAQSIVGRDYG